MVLLLKGFSLIQCWWVRPEAYPRVEYLKGASPSWALFFLTNIRLSWKELPGTNTLAFYEYSEILDTKSFRTLDPWPYSQHIIFLLTYDYFQQARVLDYIRLEKFDSDQHSSLTGPFVTFEENKVFWIRPNSLFWKTSLNNCSPIFLNCLLHLWRRHI